MRTPRSDDVLAARPTERFLSLVGAGRYPEACVLVEELSARGVGRDDAAVLWEPWGFRSGATPKSLRRELGVFESAMRGAPKTPWYFFHRSFLRGREGVADLVGLEKTFAEPRYAWMAMRAGWSFLAAGDFPRAVASFEAFLARCRWEWKARGYLAEARLCLGRRDQARRQLALAMREAPEDERPQVLAWRGEHKLWLGGYAAALKDLDAAFKQGARHAACWRAATLLRLGQARRALNELDVLLARRPEDLEAWVWRAEAKRVLGRPREALADLSREPIGFWARVNRGLALRDLGDGAGLGAELRAMPPDLVARLRRACGKDEPAALLEAALRLAKGFRREDCEQKVWLP